MPTPSILDYLNAASAPTSAIAAMADLGLKGLEIAQPFIDELIQTPQTKLRNDLTRLYEIFQQPDSDARAQSIANELDGVFLNLGDAQLPELPGGPNLIVPLSRVFAVIAELRKAECAQAIADGAVATVKQAQAATPAPANPVAPKAP